MNEGSNGKSMMEQIPDRRTCGLVESHTGASLLSRVATLLGAHAGSVYEELQPVGRTPIREDQVEMSPTRGTSCWSMGRVCRRGSGLESMNLTDHNLNFPCTCAHWGIMAEKSDVKLSPGTREGWEEAF